MKKIFTIAAMLAPLSAFASPVLESCDYEKENGREFTFLQASPLMSFKDRMAEVSYPYIVDDRFNPSPISVEKYQYRHAKLSDSSFFRRLEKNPNGKETPIRYYKAKVNNCDVVWVRLDETMNPISRYMDKENNIVSGEVPWDRIDSDLSIRFTDTYQELQRLVGKRLTVLPFRNNSVFKGKSIDSQQLVKIEDFSEMTLEKVIPNDFVYEGKIIGSIQLKVKLPNNEQAYIPWDPERLFKGNPFDNKKIKNKHYDDIKRQQIRFGMNLEEVILAWGEPELMRYLSVYENKDSKYKFIKDDQYPYGDKFTEYKTSQDFSGVKSGKYIEVFYPSRLRKSESLKFNEDGILLEYEQTKNLHKNEIHNPIALPRK